MNEFIENLKIKRVWWKPWTWRRRRIVTYMPFEESSGAVAYAVNPVVEPDRHGREIEIPFDLGMVTTWDDE